jgi:undecaprenyl phosphate N,N'-diacetylbacillosamine 1-phosphate transferase
MALTRKRGFDIVAATTGIVVFTPVMVALAVAIPASDGDSLLFRQRRQGIRRQTFTILKFRTMRAGKVSRIGRWLRGTGIDEVTQFINVLRGDMSMVGPRPLTPDDVVRFGWDDPSHDSRWGIKPGITGLCQVFGGDDLDESFRLDIQYLQDQSLRLDLELVAISFAINCFGKRRIRRLLRNHRYMP